MTPRSSSESPVTAFIFIILLCFASLAVAAIVQPSPLLGPAQPSVSSSELSSQGIQLTASINGTTFAVGGRVHITVSLTNKLSTTNDVPTENDWLIDGFPVALWGPCSFPLPVEFAVASGNYTAAQLESLTNSTQQLGVLCAEGADVTDVAFQPESSQVNLTGTTMIESPVYNQSLGSFDLTSNFTVAGYWDYPFAPDDLEIYSGDLLTPSSPCCISFQYPEVGPLTSNAFLPGAYTLAVADEWGQLMVLHFTVAAPSNPLCIEPAPQPVVFYVQNQTDGLPLTSVAAQVSASTPDNPCSTAGPFTTKSLGTMDADINGRIEVCCTDLTFTFDVSYRGQSYEVHSTPSLAGSTEYVSLDFPGGEVNVYFGS